MRKAVRRFAPCSILWRRGLPSEVAFWESFLRTEGADWPDDYRQRFAPGAIVNEPLIVDRLDLIGSPLVSILDVGAGPASSLGSSLPGRELELVAVDPLADEYNRLLDECGIEPPVRVLRCRGEEIAERFGSARFDFVHARNSVDHSANPVSVIRQMLSLARPGGFVILRHWRNEGLKADYEELHQWNMDVENGDLVIWNARHRHLLTEFASDVALDQEVEAEGAIVTAAIRRRVA